MSLASITIEPGAHRWAAVPGTAPVRTALLGEGDLSARCTMLAEQARLFGLVGPGGRWLSHAAQSLAEVVAPWEPQISPPTEERSYRLLLRTDQVEAWVIHWPSGGRLQLHDHGGASGALRVVSGELHESYIDGQCRLVARRHDVGHGVAFGPSYIHDVANTSEGPATSVHVYAPTADTMFFYRYEGPGRLLRVGEAPFEETDEAPMSTVSRAPAMASCTGDRLPH